MNNLLIFPHKRIRSTAIRHYMEEAGYKRAVCFSCGNASRELKEAGVETIDISPTGVLVANRWWTPAEVHNVFPDCFDATAGHLPLHLMLKLAQRYRAYLGHLMSDEYQVPTGSGETIICLKMAYPNKNFVAVYDLNAATEYSESAPLNNVVVAMAGGIKRETKISN